MKISERKFEIYMRKGFLKIITCLFLLVFGLGVFAACDDGAPSLEYEKVNGTYKVVGIGTYEEGELIIPETYKGKPVTAIGAEAFKGIRDIGAVVIPDSVTVIEAGAFRNCVNLTEITMSNSVTTIGKEAFAYCNQVKAITLPETLTTISEGAFAFCRNLRSIDIPDSVQTIGDYAFQVCASMKTATFGTGLRTIGEKAFWDCAALTSVVIPDGAPTNIAKKAFLNCTSLEYVSLGNDVLSVGESAFSIAKEETNLTTNITGLLLREVVIGNKVHTIGANAFNNTRKLYKITLGSGLQNIGDGAFEDCQLLREIVNDSTLTLTPGTMNYGGIAAQAWYVHNSTEPTRISRDENGLVYYTLGEKKILIAVVLADSAMIEIPDDVTEIAAYACYNEQYITGIKIGNGCKTIGYKAFGNCYKIRELYLGNTVETIEEDAFYNNVSIGIVVFGPSVKTVGVGAFRKKGDESSSDGWRDYKMYFEGTKEQWNAITWLKNAEGKTRNEILTDTSNGGIIAFYSETNPGSASGLYWRYLEDGTPKVW